MNFNDIINERRSVRSYLEKNVCDSLIYKILEYGHSAPSAGNIQPWEFIIIRDEDRKKKIVDTTYIGNDSVNGKSQDWLLSAPVFIVICGNRHRIEERYGKEAAKSILYLDTSACVENMLLGAVYLGLASCYVSGFRTKELSETLSLPRDYEPIAIIPIGYSSEVCFKRPKIDIKEIIHYEKFCK
ncbi:nitroreductase family protein [Maledivibacter halophilus]|uniref:Nitroreductase n=1 Tax=Maledivibacter halophilus TaxID=36842 RepID=A0A1T5LJE5_9FIRM|nr:nitroreductase family protein [Maledivibacter halophilus]SKC76081.1 Nitroreductase [Maledivibacter halophilus]